MQFATVLRAIVEVVQGIPEDQRTQWPYSSGEGMSIRVRLLRTSAIVNVLMEVVLEEKIRLAIEEHKYGQRRLPKYFIDRLVDRAFTGECEEKLEFLPESTNRRQSKRSKTLSMHDLVLRDLREMGFNVTEEGALVLRVQW